MLGPDREIVLRRLRTVVLLVAAWAVGAGVVVPGAAPPPQLRYVVIVSRHGVRSPMWTSERLLSQQGCGDVERIFIHADREQRTIETGRALAETLLPGCAVAVRSDPEGSSRDALFDPISAGIAKPDWEIAAKAVRERLGDHPGHFLDLHRAA